MIKIGIIKFIHFNDQLIPDSNDSNLLGQGHFELVTRATWRKSNNYVALKKLTNTIDIKNEELKAFTHEFMIHIRLDMSTRIIRCLGISQGIYN